jgi:TonB family protein
MSVVFEMVLRSSLVLLVGLAAQSLVRKQPAALRHWLLLATLALAAAQPAMNWIIPAWKIASPGGNVTALDNVPAAQTDVTFELPQLNPISTSTSRVNWIALAYRVWLAGAVLSLSILLIGAMWLTWLTWRATHAGVEWHSIANETRHRLGIRRPIRIALTQHPAMLVTWGVIKPVILLPKSAASWPAERIQLVLAHEMAHLVRRDWLVQLAAEIVRAINWFNPLFWIACARLRRESEYACDDIVLELGTGGTAYASHLVDLARSFSAHGRTWLPAPSIARPSTLERRVRAMLNPRLDRHPVSMKSRIALAAMLLAIALPIAAATQAQAMLSGTVEDPSGKPLIDATVRVSAVNSDAVFEARTDGSGGFQLTEVPPGDYMISARALGFSGQRQRLHLSSGANNFALRLSVGTLRETITVTGGAGSAPAGARTNTSAPKREAPACTPSANGGQITPPMKLRDVRPRFKQAWSDNNVSGEVLLQARIGIDGKVSAVEVVSGANAEMEDEAIAAVSQWEFSPTYLNCEPIEVRMYVSVSFKLDR